MSLFQRLVRQFDQSRSSDESLSSWLNPTSNILFAFFATLGDGGWSAEPLLKILEDSPL